MESKTKKKSTLPILLRWNIALWLFSIPLSFIYFLKKFENHLGSTGFSLGGVYTSDLVGIILLITFFLFFNSYKGSFSLLKNIYFKNNRIYFLIFIFVIISVFSSFWSGVPFLSLIQGARMTLYFILLLLVSYVIGISIKNQKLMLLVFVISGFFESMIGFFQVLFSKSLGLYYLGESHLGPEVLGLARFSLMGHNFLRSYGTFPHPNVMGGFLLFTIVASIILYKKYESNTTFLKNIKFIIAIQIIGLFITFSRSALIGLLIIVVLNFSFLRKIVKKIKIKSAILLFLLIILFLAVFFLRNSFYNYVFFQGESVKIRTELAKAAQERFFASPILGRGLGTGPIELKAFSIYPFYFFERQPVHNIYLLVLSDLGVIGLGIFFVWIYKIVYKIKNTNADSKMWGGLFVAFLFIGLFDHYLLTLPQGVFIFFGSALFFLGANQREEKMLSK